MEDLILFPYLDVAQWLCSDMMSESDGALCKRIRNQNIFNILLIICVSLLMAVCVTQLPGAAQSPINRGQ